MREKGFLLTRISRSMFFVLGLFIFILYGQSVYAAQMIDRTSTLTGFWSGTSSAYSIDDIEGNGSDIYVSNDYGGNLAIFDTNSDTSTDLSSYWSGGATALAYDTANDILYIGNSSGQFASYNVATTAVTDLSSLVSGIWTGGSINTLAFDSTNGAVYFAGENSGSPAFARYNISGGTVTDLSSQVTAFWSGTNNGGITKILFDANGNDVYIAGGDSSWDAQFARYDISGNTTTDLTSHISSLGESNFYDMVLDSTTHVIYMGLRWDFASFDTTTDTLTDLSSHVTPIDMKHFALDEANQILYIGGYPGSSPANNAFAKYDIGADSYTDLAYELSSFWGNDYGSTINAMYYDAAIDSVFIAIDDSSTGFGLFEYTSASVASLPAATTQSVSNIAASYATGNGTVTSTGGEDPTREIEWGTVSGSYTNSCSAGAGGMGTYSCTMTGLLPSTTYYVRSKVTNSAGASYGSEVSFSTNSAPTLPAVTTDSVSGTTAYGTVTSTGGEDPTREIEWGTTSGVYTSSCSAGTGSTGSYSCTMTGLASDTTYYVRAKATNYAGTIYGSEISFTSPIILEETIVSNAYVGGGTAQSWHGDDSAWNYTLPFTFNFYGSDYGAMRISSNGYICFGTTTGCTSTSVSLTGTGAPMIIPMGRDLRTDQTGNDIFITENAGNVIIRWDAVEYGTSNRVAFEVVLYENGDFQFNYGSSDSLNNNAVVGVTNSDGGVMYTASVYNGNTVFDQVDTSSWGESQLSPALSDIIIPDPTPTKMNTRVGEGYMSIDDGTITSTSSTTTAVNVTYRTTHVDAVFPTGTVTTEASNGNYNFENFTIQNITNNVKNEQPSSRVAFRLGVPSTSLNFSQNVNITAFVGEAYNDQEMDILYQNEGESTWNTHGTCTVQNGNCTFQTDHATIYTINGNLQATGSAPVEINTEVKDTLTLDCYDTTSGTGTYDVTLGTTSNPGFVTAGTPAVGTSTCDVTTNDDQGYYLSVVDDNAATNTVLTHNDPNTATIYEIQDLTPWNETTMTTENWNAPTTKGLGFSVITFPDTDTANNTFDGVWNETNQCPEGTNTDTNNYAGIPDTPEAIAAVPEYNATQTTTEICYKVDVPASQPSGIYTGSVTYTATSDASSYLN